MQEREIELSNVIDLLKIRLNLLKETGLTYIPKNGDLKDIMHINVTHEDKATMLETLRHDLGDCQRCKLCKDRNNIVFGTGSENASLVFVGEAPGRDEDLKGEPFVGRAGQLLTKMIEAMGYTRDDVYICNVIKCRPPENRDPEPDEIEACEPFLKKQLALIRPKIIVGLGRYACQTLLKTEVTMSNLRGHWHEYEGIKFMPTFHPAYLLRNPSKKKEVWEDLQMVMAELKTFSS